MTVTRHRSTGLRQRRTCGAWAAASLLALLPACMVSPYDGQAVTRTIDPVNFSGYHVTAGGAVTVEAQSPTTGSWELIASATAGDAAHGLTLPDATLYPWSTRAPIPGRFWEAGSAGRGAVARVRGTTPTSGGTYNLMSVEQDWLACFDRTGDHTVGKFAAQCASDKSPIAEVTTRDFVPAAWGVADLHAHPATHLAFGATGMVWGNPGGTLGEHPIDDDLPPCDRIDHTPGPASVTSVIRSVAMPKLNMIGGGPHGANGPPDYHDWPGALSVLHQQMHIEWIHRAYQGGLRLMFASTMDNQTLRMLWNRTSSSPSPAVPDPTFDLASARAQIAFIKDLALHNSTWMEVVTSPADARRAIRAGKLALVLASENDALTLDDIRALKALGVRSVVPVHLADNSFGGTAVYGPIPGPDRLSPAPNPFNFSNYWITGHFFRVTEDPNLSYRLGRPEILTFGSGGLIGTAPMDDASYAALGYLPPDGLSPAERDRHLAMGHRNIQGGSQPDLEALMREGLIVDIVHMSEATMADAISVANRLHYPLLNSHTGLRPDVGGDSERAMKQTQAESVTAGHGYMGLGTGPNDAADPVAAWVEAYAHAKSTFGGHGPAIGTDLNGLAREMTSTGRPSRYPLRTAADRAPVWAQSTTPPLDQYRLGTRVFDGGTDGIAHYGMLPEFFQAIDAVPADPSRGRPAGRTVVNDLFRSAEELLQFWERVNAATPASTTTP